MIYLTIIKGVIYGIFALMPGISASALAFQLGDYYKVINIITNRKFNRNNILYFLFLIVGIILGVVITAYVIMFLLNRYYKFFLLLVIFVNLYLVLKIIFQYKLNIFLILLVTMFLSFMNYFLGYLNINISNPFLLYLLSGFIYSISNIIPGLSGTPILINIGFYKILIEFYKTPINAFFSNPILWMIFIISFIITSGVLILLISKKYNDVKFKYVVLFIMIYNLIMLLD